MKGVIFVFIYIFYNCKVDCSQFFKTGIIDRNKPEILVSVDGEIITTQNVYDFAKIKCLTENKSKNLEKCITENQTYAMQNLMQCMMQFAFFEKNKMIDVLEENRINFEEYIRSVEKEIKFNRHIAEIHSINYELFSKCIKMQFISMLFINSSIQGQKLTKKEIEDRNINLMQKIQSQVTLDFKISE